MKTFTQFLTEKNWIQKVDKEIEEKGTEGKCTGKNFGGPKCPPGSPQYNLAKTFKKMANKQKGCGSC